MRANWMFGLVLVFANVVRADEPVGQDPPKEQSEKIEAVEKTTSVIVIVVDDKGNVIKKETVQIDKQGAEESPKTFRFDTKDGKLKIVLPDGEVKEIKRGSVLSKARVPGLEIVETKEGEVISDREVKRAFTIDLRATKAAAEQAAAEIEVALAQLDEANDDIRLELEKVIEEMELNAKLDVGQIADQLKAEINQLEGVKAGLKGEMVVKFGDLDVIELFGDANGKAGEKVVIGEKVVSGEKIAVLRKDKGEIRVARVVEKSESEDSALSKIMEKLDQLSTRLDKIEAKLEQQKD